MPGIITALESRWQGKTALDWAKKRNHADIATLLEQKSQQLKNSESKESEAIRQGGKRVATQASIAQRKSKK